MKEIATLTINPALDVSTSVEKVIPDRKMRCSKAEREPGGGGINVSRAIKRLGGHSTAVFTAGGETGKLLQSLLAEEEVNRLPITFEETMRESFTVLEESSGNQFRFITPGPTLKENIWSRCLNQLSQLSPPPEYIVGSGSIPPGIPNDFYAHAVEKAKEIGAKFILDTHGKPLKSAGKGICLIKANMNEIQELLGEEFKDESLLEQSMEKLIQEGFSEIIVVSLGAGGALMVSQEGACKINAPVVPIRSRVGAGDSMVAGIVMGLAQEYSLREALMFGVAAGSAAVKTPGSELCRGEDARNLFEQIKKENKKK
ncbi:MAG: 1-phosphofructokinase family hexose kinase [Candidatus Aminicenantes bacterium]|nr:1-phosphofructokinase family hexose kinase [Candidatus Aminicenantes bacterium]